jgi:hypothetical protein
LAARILKSRTVVGLVDIRNPFGVRRRRLGVVGA